MQSQLIALLVASYYLVQTIPSPIPGVSWGEAILVTATVLALIWHPFRVIRIHALHVCFLVLYVCFITITLATACFQSVFSIYDFVIRAIRWAVYILCGMILAERVDFTTLRKIFITLAVLVAFFLIVQVLVYQLTGRAIWFRLGGRVLGCSVEGRFRNGVQYARLYRFSSVFSEPAHFAYYVTVGLVLLLFYRPNNRSGIGEAVAGIIMSMAMVLSTSTYGLALLAIVLAVYLFLFLCHTRNAAFAFLVLVGILCTLGLILLFIRDTSIYSYLLSKLGSFGSTKRTTYIWQGDWQFSRLVTWLGCGVGNEEYYFRHCFNYELPYINSVSLSFLYCGIVGVVLSVLFFPAAWHFCDRNGRVFLLILGCMFLFSTMFFGPLISLLGVLIVAGEGWNETPSGRRSMA